MTGRLIDASQPVADGTETIPPLPPVEMRWLLRMDEGKPLDVSLVTAPTHAGTHVDAPSHAIPGAATIDQVPLDRFVRPAVVVPVEVGPDDLVEVDPVAAACRGVLEPGDAVLISTGWGTRFGEASYRRHPALSVELAEWLVDEGVAMVGVDLLTVDVRVDQRGEGFDYPVHRTLLGNDVLIIENLRDLSDHPGRARVSALPLHYRGRDAAPARVVLEV